MKEWKGPLPHFLSVIFTKEVMGGGHDKWGYILPFFLSNLIANIYGFFQNRETTLHAVSSKWLVLVYIVIVLILIVISTWLQGLIANLLIETKADFWANIAPTLAAMVAGTFQLIVLFPIEKFVLCKKKEVQK